MKKLIVREGNRVFEVRPPVGIEDTEKWVEKTVVSGSEIYEGEWPEGAKNFLWDEATGTVIGDDEVDLREFQETTERKISQLATQARQSAAQGADQYKLTGWVNKAERAGRWLTGTYTDVDTEILQEECDRRGQAETPQDLVVKQAGKAKALALLVAIIDGLESAAMSEFKSLQDKKEILLVISNFETALSEAGSN